MHIYTDTLHKVSLNTDYNILLGHHVLLTLFTVLLRNIVLWKITYIALDVIWVFII